MSLKPKYPHPNHPSFEEAKGIQAQFLDKLKSKKTSKTFSLMAGLDVSYTRGAKVHFAAAVVMRLPDLEMVETATAKVQVTFPYVPGYLSFRELPPLIKVLGKLKHKPNVIMADGHGIAHPRGLGLAAHLGVLFDLPTLGVAKNNLVGTFTHVSPEKGHTAPIVHAKKTVGYALRSRANTKLIYVSPGHRMDQKTALDLTQRCLTGYRMPEPTRQAHLAANAARKKAEALVT